MERNGLRLWGWVALPTFSRSQADLQHFYVNGRSIRDKLVSHAVRQAYQDVLYHGRHPAFVLYLEVDPSSVDVNVHPTKHEVRFRENRSVHDFIYSSLHHALAKVRPEDSLNKNNAENHFAVQQTQGLAAGEFQGQERISFASAASSPNHSASTSGYGSYNAARNFSSPDAIREQIKHYGELHQPAVSSLPPNEDSEIPPLGYALAQLKGIYILAENAQGLIVVDMHAAHERITYERMKESFASGGLQTQPLLVPESIAVSQKEADCAELHEAIFKDLGF